MRKTVLARLLAWRSEAYDRLDQLYALVFTTANGGSFLGADGRLIPALVFDGDDIHAVVELRRLEMTVDALNDAIEAIQGA